MKIQTIKWRGQIMNVTAISLHVTWKIGNAPSPPNIWSFPIMKKGFYCIHLVLHWKISIAYTREWNREENFKVDYPFIKETGIPKLWSATKLFPLQRT